MSNKYKKVYLNGECIIDFTKQTVNENNVASGNMFFNSEGKLVEGQDDSMHILMGANNYSYWNNKTPLYHKLSVNVPQLTDISCYYSSNSYYGFPCANYWILSDSLTSVYDSQGWGEIGGFYLPHQVAASSNIYSSLASTVKASDYSPPLQVYCADDISSYISDASEEVKRQFVFNCSEIRRTDNDLFDYVIADNKAYILNINYAKLADNVTYVEEDQGYKLSFPNTIENKPVVSINGFMFNYYANWALSSAHYFSGSFSELQLPENLEILGAGCFSSMSYAGQGIKLKLPNTLKILFGTPNNYSSNIFGGISVDLSPNIINDTVYIPDNLEYVAPSALTSLLSAAGGTIPSVEYFATSTNEHAMYVGISSDSNPVIVDDCEIIGMIPSGTTSINLPSTLKWLPSFKSNSSITSITFASSMLHITAIPENFCESASNLTAIDLPEGITKVESCAFKFAGKLLDITLPSTLTNIGYNGFYDSYSTASDSKTIKVKAQTPPTLYGTGSLAYNTGKIKKIIVPKGCLDTYKKASVWSTWATKMEESTEW